jgi:hypothetical protein
MTEVFALISMIFPLALVVLLLVLVGAAITIMANPQYRPRTKGLWLYWMGLALELVWLASDSTSLLVLVVLGVTLVAGAVTIFAMPGGGPTP